MGVFDDLHEEAYPYRFTCTLKVSVLCGGTPTDPNVAEGWLRTKLGIDKDDLIRELVATTMVERGVTAEEATTIVNTQKNLNGFKRDTNGLYIEGRQIKAMLKEAASISVAADKLDARGWGKTNKGLLGYLAEHVFVTQRKVYIMVDDPSGDGVVNCKEASGINQRFVHTFRGTGIQYEEFVDEATVSFLVIADHPFDRREWGMIWTAGEQNGLGASRSQGYGTFEVVQWDMDTSIKPPKPRVKKAVPAKKSAKAAIDEATDEVTDDAA